MTEQDKRNLVAGFTAFARVHDARFDDGYIEAMAFTDMQEGDEAADAELSEQLVTNTARDCVEFQKQAAQLLELAYATGYTHEQAGRDFWLTRNGHGAGFWDRKELEAPHDGGTLGDALSAVASGFGAVDVYKGDDGKAYLA